MKLTFTTRSPDPDYSLLEIAAELTDSTGFMPDAVAIGAFQTLMDDDEPELRAIAVFQNATTQGAEVHFCGLVRGWATRRVLTRYFWIAFDRLGHRMLRFPIPVANAAAQVLALRSGAQFEGRLRGGAADGSDAILMSMRHDECRWLLPTSNVVRLDETRLAAE